MSTPHCAMSSSRRGAVFEAILDRITNIVVGAFPAAFKGTLEDVLLYHWSYPVHNPVGVHRLMILHHCLAGTATCNSPLRIFSLAPSTPTLSCAAKLSASQTCRRSLSCPYVSGRQGFGRADPLAIWRLWSSLDHHLVLSYPSSPVRLLFSISLHRLLPHLDDLTSQSFPSATGSAVKSGMSIAGLHHSMSRKTLHRIDTLYRFIRTSFPICAMSSAHVHKIWCFGVLSFEDCPVLCCRKEEGCGGLRPSS